MKRNIKGMKLKIFCSLAASALLVQGAAHAQSPAETYPAKPVRIVVGYAPGGPTDIVARMLAAKLQASMGQSFIVENKPGAGSNIASETVARASPDGYTLLMAAAPISTNRLVYKNLKWDVKKSFEPISLVSSAPGIVAVSAKSSAHTLQDLIELARKQPGDISFATSGLGGTHHFAGELFKQRAGIDVAHVPYKGASAALNDVMAGHVEIGFMTSMSALPFLAAGNPRPLAVLSATRLPQLPDVPTTAEAGLPGVVADSWNGLFAPAKTPPEIVERLQAEVAKAVAAPDFRKTLIDEGAIPVGSSSAQFREVLDADVARLGPLAKSLNISIE